MHSLAIRLFSAAALLQEAGPRTTTVPNPMGAHTWFIILAVGAFLLWCISYALQLQKEAVARKKGREDLLRQKDELVDRLVDLEGRRETNQIRDAEYRRERKELRRRLANVLEKLAKRR